MTDFFSARLIGLFPGEMLDGRNAKVDRFSIWSFLFGGVRDAAVSAGSYCG
jgi:hypothetical protein